MTQQFDLAFNMTNSTDKMMNNNSTTTSFSAKDNNAELDTQFGSFLDNANKTYTNNKKTNDGKDEKLNLKSNDKNTLSSGNSEEKNSQTVIYDEEVLDNKSLLPEEIKYIDKVTFAEDIKVSKDVNEFQVMDEVINEALIAVNLTNTIQSVNTTDVQLNEPTPVLKFSEDIELPAEAIKSGIKFETVLTNVDTNDVDMDVVKNITQDMAVAKDDYISAMYETKSEPIVQQTNDKLTDDVKMPELPNVELKQEVKDEHVNNVLIQSKAKDQNIEEKTLNVPTDKIEYNQENTEAVKVPEFESAKEEISVKIDNKKETVKENIVQNLKSDEKTPAIQQETNIQEQPVSIENVVENSTSKEVLEPEPVSVIDTSVQQEVKNVDFQTKTQDLKQEISSAKLENAFNNVQTKIENKTSVENAKTNVEAEETMDIKEDVSGIEFVNNKFEEKSQVSLQEKIANSEMNVEKIKQRVENVKIQVEDNVKINPQVQQTPEVVNKIATANETLEKAGLSTENLQKMNAKVKEIGNLNRGNSQSDLGQSSQEMMMRDMMQNNTSATESVELKVDFNQSLNDKLQQTSLNQNQQANDSQDISILDQIRAKFAASNQNGMQKITIGLTPESLGKLTIEISRGQNGISAQILADNPQAKEMLDKNLDGLKSVLQSQGVNVNSVNVKVAEAGRSSDSNNNMFNQEESQFNSNSNGGNSKNQDDAEREKRSNYEFMQKEALKNEFSDESEETLERLVQTEKTVSIKAGSRNVSYKM